ncbi:MAG: hypothetical protein ACYDAQ_00315 [Mycobacteriales bacterium]
MVTKQVEPDLLPQHAYRALLYVERLNAVGFFPAPDTVEGLSRSDGPRGAVYSSPLFGGISSMIAMLGNRGELIHEAEPVVDWLTRMKWVTGNPGGGLRLTDLGAALLAGLREAPPRYRGGSESDETAAVILHPDDPFVYPTLTRTIAAAGEALLIDPYFKSDMLSWLHDATQVTRLMMSSEGSQEKEVQLVAMTLHAMRETANIGRVQVRATKSRELHDRLIIPDKGDVLFLGTSITGIGQHLSTIVPMPSVAGNALRAEYEQLWEQAVAVPPLSLRRAVAASDDAPPESESDTNEPTRL